MIARKTQQKKKIVREIKILKKGPAVKKRTRQGFIPGSGGG
jgi:hypothetical protein